MQAFYDLIPPVVYQECRTCGERRAEAAKREPTDTQRRELRERRIGWSAPLCVQQLYDEVERWTYKPGWRMWIEYRPIAINMYSSTVDNVRLRIEFDAVDSRGSGVVMPIGGSHAPPMFGYILEDGTLTEQEIEYFRRWLVDTLMEAERHELREWLRFDGELYDDPHRTDKR